MVLLSISLPLSLFISKVCQHEWQSGGPTLADQDDHAKARQPSILIVDQASSTTIGIRGFGKLSSCCSIPGHLPRLPPLLPAGIATRAT
jgi:hypothetical protein